MNHIYYKSTRNNDVSILASRAILKGISDDGGLYVPERVPELDFDIKDIVNMDYKEIAYKVMKTFFTDFTEEELKYCIENAYDSKFDTEEIAPIKKAGDTYFLELYHGPTLAFKDMALSILPYLLKTASKKNGIQDKIVILTATSGDTGKAALEGFKDVEGTEIIVFFPNDGVSEVQRLQMVTQKGKNTHVVAIRGNFDDAQSGVKKIFTDKEFIQELKENNCVFSSANSINIGRLVPQIVYYFYAYSKMCSKGEINFGEKINFVVPTGNFGNILAAYFAKSMGVPINKLICASNDNKVLYDFFENGTYDRNREFVTTISPSMDILISSNLERLIYLVCDRDSSKVADFMRELSEGGKYNITENMKKKLKDFYAGYATEEETKKAIEKMYKENKYLIDTHTAVAYSVYEKYLKNTKDKAKTVIASTASPYKFTNAVMTSLDNKYASYDDFELMKKMSEVINKDIPSGVKGLNERKVIHKDICSKDEMKKIVRSFLGK
ncbi:threonine synthase [Clostridium acetobutylicum]|uniref:Threonine synthase n=1 Tax=Clostridium acetobutylicum (strain ATCC 824 / DSM 792 / JCM 1419 / IAM 19013 / LMG 5710 / NBRC 13948 / NRRL B-527 / VKM B-1787 / 2291 / W) TaxID=272562 RepID=Q97KC0_CLOAB|nr:MULTISPECIES: threonine synthase [Clostridium]AAK78975.1 Threonine synthase [Clostridium acetobutylicum ATCC 824]ADZ20049.1 threonine synthase [Clostridium acetobutylicum EA 2018]AEI34119.1 threonine synthase [Clostridium acetobutylicum DSM 1731]AWV81769.1 threonine synthase [Clostridium acetobutylicum]MBC2395312.1 threonine synthase [Clostridium acetobutylicum]